MMDERIGKLQDAGQSVWIDSISRDDLESGNLQGLVDEGVTGITSNPTIFQEAISESSLYDDQIAELSRQNEEPKEIFLALARDDITNACDFLRPVWDKTGGKDGHVSLEVSPDLAYDTDATVEEAQRLHEMVDRPNLLVKIPAAGLNAIEEMISRGRSINVTLIFSLERYRQVTRSYIRGLSRLVENGGDPSNVASVASFFVSRVDSEADKRLDKVGREDLQGRLAIENAKLAYAEFEEIFSGSEWEELEAKGANRQRPLWASTSVKNPEYRDTAYVEALVGPDTVDTMPHSTYDAVKDHAEVRPGAIQEGVDEAHKFMQELEKAGIDYEDVTDTLEREGVQKFADSFDDLMGEIRQEARRLAG
jgi:transaldolase